MVTRFAADSPRTRRSGDRTQRGGDRTRRGGDRIRRGGIRNRSIGTPDTTLLGRVAGEGNEPAGRVDRVIGKRLCALAAGLA